MSGIVGSSLSVHPLLVFFATLHLLPTLFERWQKVPIVEEATRVAASGEEFAGIRGCAGREG